jgi:RNA polymerase sigma-70 factor, ECF subfamily
VLHSADVTDGQAGFRCRRALEDSPESVREVRLAIARAKEGDREALRLLYIRYSDNVYGYVRSIVRDDKEAEDLTQQVFMKLITVIVKYQDYGVPFSGWLLRLARNVALDHLRRRRPTPTEDVLGADSHDDDDARERARDLQVALASLPDEQRNVMIMRHVVGLSPPEIAEQMGRSESSVHGLHHRGRRALQQELSRLGSAPATSVSIPLRAA